MGSSDSESEDERRVVRSAKDKATEELMAVCNEIRVRPFRKSIRMNNQTIDSAWMDLALDVISPFGCVLVLVVVLRWGGVGRRRAAEGARRVFWV